MRREKIFRLITMLMCLCLILSAMVPLQNVYAKNEKGTVTADSLNVRTGPGTTYDKLEVDGAFAYLVKGDIVTILQEKNGWYHIEFTFGGKTQKGYVLSDYVKKGETSTGTTVESTSTSGKTATVVSKKTTISGSKVSIPGRVSADVLNLRSKASTASEVKMKLTKGVPVTIKNELVNSGGKWYKVKSGKKTGYVLSTYVDLVIKGSIKANISSSTKVKPRTRANNTAGYVKDKKGKLISLKNKQEVKILSEVVVDDVRWFKVSFQVSKVTYKGYLPADLVVFKSTSKQTETKPSEKPSTTPSEKPSTTPSEKPSTTPSEKPSTTPSEKPSTTPSEEPSVTPSEKPSEKPSATPTPDSRVQAAVVTECEGVYLYSTAGYTTPPITNKDGYIIYISGNTPFAVYSETISNGEKWYYCGIEMNNVMYYGYVVATNVRLDNTYYAVVSKWAIPDLGSGKPVDETIPNIEETKPPKALTAAEFEASLSKQGFPESYKPYLRELHKKYPYWTFEAHQTGLDWKKTIQAESKVGLNLISNAKSVEWKSLATGAYDWSSDKFIPYDGSSWVTVSEQGLAYYMDPRNFLDEKAIFQFELLSFQTSYQNLQGIENILKDTPLYQTSFQYKDDNGIEQSCTYAKAIYDAAVYSNVSPYHLATRIKQEVVTGKTSLSSSVSGKVSGHEGYYNFYNIGAYHSTANGGAVANALNYAKNGTSSASLNQLYRIPWDNPYDAIVGGAYIIGQNYINRGNGTLRGQDTIYLQKFNVTNKTTYAHQYMANVEAAWAEGKKVSLAYQSMSDVPIVFSIPVFKSMPSKNSPLPTTMYNPNNWLKSLYITNEAGEKIALTPTFDQKSEGDYSLIVTSDIAIVNVHASTVSKKAKILSGVGNIPLEEGMNSISVDVQAENGDIKSYRLYIVRQEVTEEKTENDTEQGT